NGGSSSRSAAVAGTACLAAFFVTDLVAFFAAAFLAVVFFTAFLAALVAVVLVAFLAAVLPAFSGRGSNSKPILPSFCATRKALNLRLVREETKLVSRSVLPSASSFCICSGLISCW